ncbi:hypothetical protein OA79_00950 [Marinomonas sp. TW1]|nr:hypothetical protein OA79_00950 [Marinomonas sp. TW1]
MLVPSLVAIAVSIAINAKAEEQESDTAQDQIDVELNTLGSLYVYGEPEEIKSATKLNLSVYETPQTVSVISEDQMEDLALTDVASLLHYAPGVTVENVEPNRTYYTARGFDIVNFQYDGVGVPFSYGLTQGQEDTAIYEQVEVVKGATGLITSLANPSATINYVRKRPTKEAQASVEASAGSWNQRRVEGDVSGSIVGDKLKGRIVVAKEEGDSYLDRYSKEREVFYGILSGDITDSTRYAIGHSINDSHADGNPSGALPLFYSDGSLTSYSRSTNTAPDWAYQDVTQTRTFLELEHDLSSNWMVKAIYTRDVQEKEWESFYTTGNPDPNTGTGLTAEASYYEAKETEQIIDLFVTGSLSAWGQDHELVAGVNMADIELTGRTVYASAWRYNSIGSDWADGNVSRPDFDAYDASSQSTDINQTQDSYYVSTRIKANDDLAVLLGARAIDIEQSGINYGSNQDASANEVVPYIGVTYEAMVGTLLYGSYSKVFKAQTWVDDSLNPLGPVEGDSYEFGLKQELYDGRAVLTLARFGSEQDNFGEYVTRDATSGLNIYKGVTYKSEGYEVELSGEVLEGLNVSAGYTTVRIEDKDGKKARTYIPTEQFSLALAYHLPQIEGLRLGTGVNWQNEIYYSGKEVQGSYALVDMFAQYNIDQNWNLALNIKNVGDEKYRESPQWGQSYYGPGRSVLGTVTWTY